jgi:hypothetical protein
MPQGICNLRYDLLHLEGCPLPVCQNHLHRLQIGDWAALKIRRHSVARFAGQDCDSDPILDEIENAVRGWHFLDDVRLEPGLRTLVKEPPTQSGMRPLRARNDQGTRSQIGESYLSGALRGFGTGEDRMQALETEWDLFEIVSVERRPCQACLEHATFDGFECFRRAGHPEFEM